MEELRPRFPSSIHVPQLVEIAFLCIEIVASVPKRLAEDGILRLRTMSAYTRELYA